jgi:hypothetical protein
MTRTIATHPWALTLSMGHVGFRADLSRVVHREVTYSRVRHALRLREPTDTDPARRK